jgi:F-type H+-transporting ATPase subunit delta
MIEFATVARPYAKALFELAEEKSQTENWKQGLIQLAWLLNQPQVKDYIQQSDLDAGQKADELIRLLDNAEATQSAEFRNFVHIVAQEKRLEALPIISEQFQQLILEKDDAREAVIYTAFEIQDEAQRIKIVSDLEQQFHVRLQPRFELDDRLIGGIKVVVGDQVLDLSVQGKLQKLYATIAN